MRILCVVSLLLASTSLVPSRAAQSTSAVGAPAIEGAWELASYRYASGTKITSGSNSGKTREIKLLANGRFLWAVYDLKSKAPTSSGGGTYVLTGSAYTERLEFATARAAALVGKAQSFNVTIQNDQMIQSGVLSDGTKIDENWRRLRQDTDRGN